MSMHLAWLAALSILAAPSARAIGLSSPMGEVILEGVPLGTQINIRELAGRPYRVINTSLSPLNVDLSVYRPTPGEMREGYELLPDSVTVRLGKSEFYLAPGQEGVSDVWIEFPKDPKYLGKKYEVQLWARTRAFESMLAVGVYSRLLIRTSQTMATPQQKQKIKEIASSLEFNIVPSQITLPDFPLGAKVAVSQEFKKQFKVVNFHEEPLRMSIRILEDSRTSGMLPPGHSAGKGEWLTLEKATFVVAPNSIGEVPFSIRIPDKPEHRGQRYYFVVEATLEGYEVPVSAFGRISVETQGGRK